MRTRNIANAIVGAIVCATLGGCATGYGKHGFTGGYIDKQLSESSYHVQFAGNGYATGERVHMFFLYRCAELTLEKGFDFLVITPDKAKASIPPPDDTPRATPAVYHPGEGAGAMRPVYYYTYTITTYNASGKVEMYRSPLTYDVPWALDARKMQAGLKPYVESNGAVAAPDLKALGDNAAVTHESISYPIVAQTRVEPLDKADAGKALRSGAEIAEVFRRHEMMLHALFNGRRKITGGTDGGRIELAFTVTPGGVVTSPRVVSTSFKDASFASAVAQSLKSFQFQSGGATMARVNSFTVEFAPIQ